MADVFLSPSVRVAPVVRHLRVDEVSAWHRHLNGLAGLGVELEASHV